MNAKSLVLCAIVAVIVPNVSRAQSGCDTLWDSLSGLLPHKKSCCDHCGCSTGCRKVCKLVQEDRKITVTCWGIKEEAFCVGEPGCVGCEHCESVCGDCVENRKAGVIAAETDLSWRDWCPADCGEMFTRKKLMKRTETKTVPGFKWVVEDLCAVCRAQKDESESSQK